MRAARLFFSFVSFVALAVFIGARAAPDGDAVETALIMAVDVSGSIDDRRYRLQMQGIAAALEDPAVIEAMLGYDKNGILFTLITWADDPQIAIPWSRIGNVSDARAIAARVRRLPQQGGEFTCIAGALRYIREQIVPQAKQRARNIVLDVSGDGTDNCNPQVPVGSLRDQILKQTVVINGLPIMQGPEGKSLVEWYRDNVIGGPGAFLLAANGYEDFGRAIRQKFVVEVSGGLAGERPLRGSEWHHQLLGAEFPDVHGGAAAALHEVKAHVTAEARE